MTARTRSKKQPSPHARFIVITPDSGKQDNFSDEVSASDIAKRTAAEVPGARIAVYKLVATYISEGVHEERVEG